MNTYSFRKKIIIICILSALFGNNVVVASGDRTCLIVPQELSQHIKKNDVQIIDVRSSAEFLNYHIKGSINLRLHEISSKSFLKRKHLIIAGSGWDEDTLTMLCRKEFRQKLGSKISVLDGGVATWFQHQIISERMDNVGQALFYVSSSELYRAENKSFIPLLLEKDVTNDISHLFENIVNWNQNITAKLKLALDKHDKRNLPVILINNTGKFNDINEIYRVLSPRNVYILKGGARSYANFSVFSKSLTSPGISNVKKKFACEN